MEKLKEIADLLLEKETIDADDFEALFSGKKTEEADIQEAEAAPADDAEETTENE